MLHMTRTNRCPIPYSGDTHGLTNEKLNKYKNDEIWAQAALVEAPSIVDRHIHRCDMTHSYVCHALPGGC